MNQRISLFSSSNVTISALLVAAVGIVIQIVSGVDYPPVPPGLVILLAAAALVAFEPWWAPVVGAAVGLFLLVGFFASGATGNLLDPSQLGVLVGSWVLFLAVIVAVIAGTTATIQSFRTRHEEVG